MERLYFILIILLVSSCDFNELASNVLGFSHYVGKELPVGSDYSPKEIEILSSLCESFQRKSIGLSKERSSDYHFYIEEGRCDGKKSTTSDLKNIRKGSNGLFEFTGGKKNSLFFKEVETHEQGIMKETCKELIFSQNLRKTKIKNYFDTKDGRVVIQVKKSSHDTINLVVFYGKKLEKEPSFKVNQVEFMSFLSEPRGKYGEGVMLERSYIKECPFGSLEKLTNFAAILEQVIH